MVEQDRRRIEPLTQASLPRGVWSTPVPIRFGHCDPAGIVFTPRYFDLCIEVIEQFFVNALAIDYYGLIRDRRIGLGYGHAACDFLKPSRMGETLEAAVVIERIGRASYTQVLHLMKDGVEVVRGRFVSVATRLDAPGAIPLPEDVAAALRAYRARCQD